VKAKTERSVSVLCPRRNIEGECVDCGGTITSINRGSYHKYMCDGCDAVLTENEGKHSRPSPNCLGKIDRKDHGRNTAIICMKCSQAIGWCKRTQ
jgi:hypothetical protein